MRKLIASAMALSCLLLCACGNTQLNGDMLPDTIPPVESMMPDYEDGVVEDNDGVIDENEGDSSRTTLPNSTARP